MFRGAIPKREYDDRKRQKTEKRTKSILTIISSLPFLLSERSTVRANGKHVKVIHIDAHPPNGQISSSTVLGVTRGADIKGVALFHYQS